MDELSEIEREIREDEDAELTDLAADISLAEQMLEEAQRRYNDRQKEIAERRLSVTRKRGLKRTYEILRVGNENADRDTGPVSKVSQTTVCEDIINNENGDAIGDASPVSKVPRISTLDDGDEYIAADEIETDPVVHANFQVFSGPVVKRVIEGLAGPDSFINHETADLKLEPPEEAPSTSGVASAPSTSSVGTSLLPLSGVAPALPPPPACSESGMPGRGPKFTPKKPKPPQTQKAADAAKFYALRHEGVVKRAVERLDATRRSKPHDSKPHDSKPSGSFTNHETADPFDKELQEALVNIENPGMKPPESTEYRLSGVYFEN